MDRHTPRVDGVSYLVCATQRSGSTLLCELLKGTEVAGVPDEFFEALRSTGLPRQPRQYFEDPAVADIADAARAARPRPARAARRVRGMVPLRAAAGHDAATVCSAPR